MVIQPHTGTIFNMPSYHCMAVDCQSDSRKWKNMEKYPSMVDVEFIPFPKNVVDRRIWFNLLRRGGPSDHLTVNRLSRYHPVCSEHFVDGVPTQANSHPTLFSYNNFKKSDRPRNHSSTHTTEETTPKRPRREPRKPRSLLINRASLLPTLSLPGLKLTKVASHSGDVASCVEVAAEPPPVEQNCNGK